MRARALRPRPHLMVVVRTGVVEVMDERPNEGGEQFQLREARRQAKVDDEMVHAKRDIRAVHCIVVLMVTVARLEGTQEAMQHRPVNVARLVQLVPFEERLTNEEEGVSARGLLQRERVVVPRVQARQRIRPCTVADRERLLEELTAQGHSHGFRQHPQ